MLASLPVVLLLTSRDAEADPTPELAEALADLARADLVRVALRGLDQAGVREYVALPPRRRDPRRGGRRPSGNAPTATRSSSGSWSSSWPRAAARPIRGPPPRCASPTGSAIVVRRRISQLPDDVEPLLSTAAVYGRTFDADLVEAASGLSGEAALTATEAALLAGLIEEEDDGHRFTHALVREAIYARLPPAAAVSCTPRSPGRSRPGPTGASPNWPTTTAGPEPSTPAPPGPTRRRPPPSPPSSPPPQKPPASRRPRCPRCPVTAPPRDADRYEVLLGLALARKRAGDERQAWDAAREAAEVALAGGDVVAAARAAVTTTTDAIWSWREYQVVDVAAVALFERLARELPRRTRGAAGPPAGRPRRPRSTTAPTPPAARWPCRPRPRPSPAPTAPRADLARVLELRHVAYERPRLLTERLAAASELVRSSADDPVARAARWCSAAGTRSSPATSALACATTSTPGTGRAACPGSRPRRPDVGGRDGGGGQGPVRGGGARPSPTRGSSMPVRPCRGRPRSARPDGDPAPGPGTLPAIEPMLAEAAAATGLSWCASGTLWRWSARAGPSRRGPYSVRGGSSRRCRATTCG